MAADGETTNDEARADAQLRPAMLADGQQHLPRWLPLPGIATALTWAGYQAVSGAGDLLPTLLWPGAAIFLVTTITAYFGWRLDLD